MGRRQRRLRQFLRHERLSVAMAVAEFTHHIPQDVRGGPGPEREDHEMHYPGTFRTHPLPQAAVVQHFFCDDDEPPAAGSRPDRLSAVSGPQERVQRRIVAQIEVTVPSVAILDVLVPQMVDQLVVVLQGLDMSMPVEPWIEVPKITLEDGIPQRAVLREPLPVEQLVDVPEVVILARDTSALGLDWCQVAAPGGGFWWQTGTRNTTTDPPQGFTASPGRFSNTGQD